MASHPELERIRWKCRRGMLELDITLEHFCNTQLASLSEKDLQTFDRLLDSPDPVLYSWMIGQSEPEDPELIDFLNRFFP